ncbi:MAG: hypothetical protein AB2531_07645 [Candidatus Thiodiazotropha sp.]
MLIQVRRLGHTQSFGATIQESMLQISSEPDDGSAKESRAFT